MKTYIIAEAGVNHNGSLELAKKLVDEGKKAGVDCVKFQTFVAENIVTKSSSMAEYQKKNTNKEESQYDMLKRLELSFKDFIELKKYCDSLSIDFMSTAFDFDSIDFLNDLGMCIWKIPSGEITNLPYIEKVARINKPIIISTGMCYLSEVEDAIEVLYKEGALDITILHCTTEYPTPFSDVNLKALKTLEDKFKVKVGYSDHTNGIEVPIAAVALGATVIEKHFTLDKNMEGPDHKASLEPHELKAMVDSIRNIEKAMGNGIKEPVVSEKKNIEIARKSIIAKSYIKKGEMFSTENLTVKRPGNGISPMKWYEVIGKVAGRDFMEDEMIEL